MRLTPNASTDIEIAASTRANTSACRGVRVPETSGRHDVRAICASMRLSSNWLIAAALDAASQMPNVPNNAGRSGGRPGTARNMPITAVNTISATTRGLVRLQYCLRTESAMRSRIRCADARDQFDQHEQQQSCPGVVQHRDVQRQCELDVGDAQADLRDHQAAEQHAGA